MVKASATGGVKPMTIQGRLAKERERLVGMTEDERLFRKQFLKDQVLSPNEPRHVPELYKELNNPIRRMYKYPLNCFQKMIEPTVGPNAAAMIRVLTGKFAMGIVGLYFAAYYFKYNASHWTKKGGWNVYTSRDAVFPGDPQYPRVTDKSKPSDYASKGFDKFEIDL